MKYHLPKILLAAFLFPLALHASKEDSLKALLRNSPDSQKINIYIKLAYSAKNFSDARDYFSKAEHLADSLKLDRKLYNCYEDKAIVFEKFGELEDAMKFYLAALNKAGELHDTSLIADCYLNISWLNFEMKKYPDAEKYGFAGLRIFEKLKDNHGIANACNNLATYKKEAGKYDSALYYHHRALDIRTQNHDAHGISYSLNNIGLVYLKMEKYPEAIDYLNKSYHIKDSLHDVKGMAGSLINISNAYIGMNQFDKALDFGMRGTKLADSARNKIFLKNGYEALAESYKGLKQYEQALDYLQKYVDLNQQLLDADNLKQVNEMEAKYEAMKNEQKIATQNAENERLQSDLSKKNFIIYGISVVGLLLIVLAVVVFRGYRQKKRTLVLISSIRDRLEQKNQEISDSINYAKNIQRSLLPDAAQLNGFFSDSFVLNIPKDIVSGDFFTLASRDGKNYLAVADCTGHGVPGAFMSMLGIDKLNQSILESKTGQPGEILSLLNSSIRATLKQQHASSSSKDGMDIALLCFDRQRKEIIYAGANRPLWMVRNGSLEEFRPTKAAIGGTTGDEQVFTDNVITVSANDQLYLFSDGYADQFGGVKGKKMMTKNFRSLVQHVYRQPFDEQKNFLHEKLKEWQGGFEQVDDILVVGVKV